MSNLKIKEIFNAHDKYKGLLVGLALGDALGAPYEAVSADKITYATSDPISRPLSLHNQKYHKDRFNHITHLDKGQITDDTEMAICIINSLANGTDRVLEYLEWANSENSHGMGKNTRQLFKGIKTKRGYENRYASINTENQSNGALMRCAVLSITRDPVIYEADCRITNPHQVCINTNLIYLKLIEGLIDNDVDAYDKAIKYATALSPELVDVINLPAIYPKINKGHCIHGLHLAFKAIAENWNITQAMTQVLAMAGDTDTNMAIVGAVVGAKYGFTALYELQKANIDILLSCDTIGGNKLRNNKYLLKSIIK
jgi:ADP-ribosylglycohydrolase